MHSPFPVHAEDDDHIEFHLQGSNKKPGGIWFHAGFLLGLFFDLEDGGDILPRNVG
jgi:hypothetical protein